jgi:hypothetical protein
MKEDEICRACSPRGREGKFIQNFDGKNLEEKDNLEDLVVDRTVLIWI